MHQVFARFTHVFLCLAWHGHGFLHGWLPNPSSSVETCSHYVVLSHWLKWVEGTVLSKRVVEPVSSMQQIGCSHLCSSMVPEVVCGPRSACWRCLSLLFAKGGGELRSSRCCPAPGHYSGLVPVQFRGEPLGQWRELDRRASNLLWSSLISSLASWQYIWDNSLWGVQACQVSDSHEDSEVMSVRIRWWEESVANHQNIMAEPLW